MLLLSLRRVEMQRNAFAIWTATTWMAEKLLLNVLEIRMRKEVVVEVEVVVVVVHD
jgi:hypothetical protein